VTFEEAVKLVGRRPGGESRQDLIVLWGVTDRKKWQWCRDVEKKLPEAIEIHQKMGEEYRVVTDKVEKEAKRKSGRGRGRLKFAPDGPAVHPRVETPQQESPPRLGDPYLVEPDAEGPGDEVPVEAGLEGAGAKEEEEGSGSVELRAMNRTEQAVPEPKEANPEELGQMIAEPQAATPAKPRTALSVWLDDISARLAISSVAMLGPDVGSLVIAPHTFLPLTFLSAQSAFIVGTVVSVATQGYRGRRKGTRSVPGAALGSESLGP
jgi:hypothetical protein